MKPNKLNMLVVDDEIGILLFLKEVFEPRGWNVITTPTGSSVVPIIEKEKVDVILLDIRLPDGSGLDILKEVKAKNSAIPIVMYTALGYDDGLIKTAFSLGASGYVSKAVPIKELIEVVKNTLVKKSD